MKQKAPGLGIMLAVALLLACGEPSRRLDEYVFYDGPVLRLKVVRYYRNIPFSPLGEHAVVMCRSGNTADAPAIDGQDAGWRVLGSAPGLGSKDARDVALQVMDEYEVRDDRTLIAKTPVFNISFDACGHFINWDPGRLPGVMIDPVEKPDSCAPIGNVDCRPLDFEGDRAPHYEQIDVPATGQVGFTVSSKAFRDVHSLRVHTRNNGAVWHVDTQGHGEKELVPDGLRSLPATALETGKHAATLADWFESVLPPGSMVVWPDALTACGEQQAANGAAPSSQCTGIRFTDGAGNSGVLYLLMDAGPEPPKASFHSGVFRSGNSSRSIGSPDELRDILAAGTE